MRHDEALLGAVMAEPALFELLVDDLKLPTTEGDLTVPVIASLSGNRTTVNNESDEDAEARMARLWQHYERTPRDIDCLGKLVDALEIQGWHSECVDVCADARAASPTNTQALKLWGFAVLDASLGDQLLDTPRF